LSDLHQSGFSIMINRDRNRTHVSGDFSILCPFHVLTLLNGHIQTINALLDPVELVV
jgi:hypothetical protein